jgi:hypothetical protein
MTVTYVEDTHEFLGHIICLYFSLLTKLHKNVLYSDSSHKLSSWKYSLEDAYKFFIEQNHFKKRFSQFI